MKLSLNLLFYFIMYSKAVDVVHIHWKEGEGENNTTTASPSATTTVPFDDCSELGLFSCEGEDTNECIDINKQCDGRKDCLNGRDEEECHTAVTRSTVAEDVTGSDVYDDGYDENYGSCSEWDMFSCDQTEMKCVLFEQLCDGHNDCYNGMDEENCAGNAVVATAEDTVVVERDNSTCEAMDLYSCLDRANTCVKLEEICDGVNHCVNGRDEISCEDGVKTEETCSGDKFICIGDTHLCLERSVICDGSTDCPSGEDEQNCETTNGTEGSSTGGYGGEGGGYGSSGDAYGSGGYGGGEYGGCENETDVFLCHDDSNSCIELGQVCNGNEDCENGRDEQNCTYTTEPISTTQPNSPSLETTTDDYDYGCLSDEFQCNDFICIPVKAQCDGFSDCDSGEDEQGCDTAKNCTDLEFKCADGACIPFDFQCNGAYDCIGGDDEENCGGAPELSTTTTAQPTATQLISTTAETTTIALPTTTATQSTTMGPTTKVTTAEVTTTIQTTTNVEEVTTTTESQTTTPQTSITLPEPTTTTSSVVVTTELICLADQLKCGASCISRDQICDGNVDCPGGDDEQNCEHETTTAELSTTTKRSFCFYRGYIFEQGQSKQVNNCTVVTCEEGGKVSQEITPGCGSCGLLPNSIGITLMTLLTIFYLRNH